MGRGVNVGRRTGKKPSAAEKLAITAAGEKFMADVLKPGFCPCGPSTEFNYPIAFSGGRHGNKYRFRSDDPHSYEPEFEEPFARLEYVGQDRFDVSYQRHTGEWFCMFQGARLAEALGPIENYPAFPAVLTTPQAWSQPARYRLRIGRSCMPRQAKVMERP